MMIQSLLLRSQSVVFVALEFNWKKLTIVEKLKNSATKWLMQGFWANYRLLLMFLKINFSVSNLFLHSVHPPTPFPPFYWVEGLNLLSQFWKEGGLDSTSTFRRGLVGKRTVTFSKEGGGGLQFLHKRWTKIWKI